MSNVAAAPVAPRTPRTRNTMTCWQLRAYVRILLDNLEHASPSPALDAIRAAITIALGEFEEGRRDKLSLFFEIKALEYRAARLLHLTVAEYKLYLRTDLSQTPATEAQIKEICDTFFANDDDASELNDAKAARVTLIALAYWQQYADGLLKASRREKYIAIFLGICLALYLSPLILLGAHELMAGTFFTWFQGTSDKVIYLALGCAGAIVSMSLSGRAIAVMANRPLDDIYLLPSMVPRLLIGALAGAMASNFIYMILPLLKLPGTADESGMTVGVLQLFLAFSGGFADRLFLHKLVDATWKMSGLTPPAEK